MWRRISVCVGEAACGTENRTSNVAVQRPCSQLSTPESRLRYPRNRSRTCDGSCENTLLLLHHNHAKSNDSSSQLHRSVAIDSGPDQPGESLILRARKLPG